MQGVKNRGLSGKARQTRERRRAARLQASQLVMDYFNLEPSPGAERFERVIPIHQRSEALVPSSTTFEHIAYGADQQLDLAFRESEPVRDEAVCCIPPDRRKIDSATQSASQERQDGEPYRARDTAALRLVEPAEDSPARFTTRGFLCGCAMGAAAAAVVLLVLQAALK